MIEGEFYLVAAYLIAALHFGGFMVFFIWRYLSLRRHVTALEKCLIDKES